MVLSLTLPNVTGYELYAAIRGHQNAALKNVGILFIGDKPPHGQLKELGRDEGKGLVVLTRPVSESAAVDALESVLTGAPAPASASEAIPVAKVEEAEEKEAAFFSAY